MTARTPGKLILSGEHAVVYGQPALACTVSRFMTATIHPQEHAIIELQCEMLSIDKHFPLQALETIHDELLQRYQQFKNAQRVVSSILQSPDELCLFVIQQFCHHFQLNLSKGLGITIDSDLPMGCGMGSSAALIVCLLHALCHHFNIEARPSELLPLALAAENLQHGYSSGIDIKLVLFGGLNKITPQGLERLNVKLPKLTLINTGKPHCSTGDCVTFVKEKFEHSDVWPQFGETTKRMTQSLLAGDTTAFKSAISDNQALLEKIGVVPKKTSDFILSLKQAGMSAKVCGAGAITGDHAGIIMAIGDADIASLCQPHAYPFFSLHEESHGSRID